MKDELLAEALKLSVEERIELAQALWESLADEDKVFPLTQDQRDELDRRQAEFEADPEAGIPWEEARARIERSLAGHKP